MAGHLGKTVAELEASLSLEELWEWQTFDRVDPIGGYRGDLQTAHIIRAQVGGSLQEHLAVDPYPKTTEQRLAIAAAEHEAQQTEGFDRLLGTLQKYATPIPKKALSQRSKQP